MTDARRTDLAVTAIVVVLGLALLGLVSGFWVTVLEPRLKAEAVSQAEILAHSQANLLANALTSASGADRVRTVVRTMDELLLLRDPATKTPFFQSIELQVDYDAVQADTGTLDLRRGTTTPGGFRTEVAVYNPQTNELLGVAFMQVSDRFFQQLSRDLRRGLWTVLGAALTLLLLVWVALLFVLRKLRVQTTERVRVERKYERLVNNLSTYFVYGRDAEGRMTFASESAQRVLGYSNEELMKRFPSGAAGSQPAEAGELRARRSTSDTDHTYTIEIADAQGDVHYIELSEVRTEDGFDGIARDMTAQRLFEEELRHAKEQAEAANRAKSQFLANMSHEIRTPLNAIVGMTALALKNEVPPRVRNFLDKIRASAHLLAEIIEDILDLSRIEAGRLEIQRIDFDLDDLLADVSDVVGVKAADKDLEILFSAAPDVPRRLRGDPVRLKQILLNLLGNALKFTASGEIVVEITVADARRDLAELKFSVRDTGIGIPAEHLATLFEPFTQVDASLTRRFGGLGLGLAISRRLVSMMGGELQVDSRTGEGSIFTFTAAFDLPRGAAGPRRLADEFRDLPVLVADDNANARIVLASMLRSLSCRVTAVESGEEALREAERAASGGSPFKLAVLDWKMPHMDGAETAVRLGDLPVILVTAYDRDEAMKRAEKAGIDVVLHKPVSPSTLHDAVVRILDGRGAAGSQPAGRPAITSFAAGQRVLLVEDNMINREVAREMLTLAGLDVMEAHNGLEALRLLDEQTFDLVLMDVQMPELDGIETVRALRAQERFRDLPVVAITAHAMLGDRERFLEAGMTDYVSKPIEETALMTVLTKHLRNSDAPADSPASTRVIHRGSGLHHVSGNAALYERLLQQLAKDNETVLPRLRDHIARNEREEALNLLHTLKGSSATLGARALSEAAAELETLFRTQWSAGAAEGGGAPLSNLARALDDFGTAAARVPIRNVEDRQSCLSGQAGGQAGLPVLHLHERALPLLRKLADLLPQNNLGAIDTFQELKSIVGARPSLEPLEDALDRLDFASAIPHLQSIERELAG